METTIVSNTQAHRPEIGAFSPYAERENDGHYTLTFLVEGIHCASCIQLIENALKGQAGVLHARVNMSTNRLTIRWKGEATQGDELAQRVITLGYKLKPFSVKSADKQRVGEETFLLRCIAVSGFAMGNIMLISVGLWSASADTMGISTRELFHWLSAMIALPTIAYAGRPFFRSAFSVLRYGRTNMDVPISLAVLLASGMSVLETLNHGKYVYFDSAIMLLFFLLIGRYLDVRAKGKARESAKELLSMLSGTATILTACGHHKMIPIRDVKAEMTVLVAMGENIPSDSVVSKGESEVDMSLITGETMPQHVGVGDRVFAGTTNMSAPLQLTVAKAGSDSLLSDIVKLMEKAEQGQAHYVRLADKAARLYTPLVHTLGALTFFYWWLAGGLAWQPSLLIAITVLIITCPCALGLAVPVVQVLASAKLMKQGILLKSGDALERLASIRTAVFDKTGTLTIGRPRLEPDMMHVVSDVQFQLAASLASHSKHPLSRAISEAYAGPLIAMQMVEELPGNGLEGMVEGTQVRLGSRKWCGNSQADEPEAMELWLAVGELAPVRFAFSDALKPDATQVIAAFKKQQINPVLLSGDRRAVVDAMAHTLAIAEHQAELSPIEKCSNIEAFAQQGGVLMVGDGLNDAPSLAAATVSMSPSSAIDISQNTADIVFHGDTLAPVFYAWQTARRATTLVKQNFALAVIYNIFAIPLAVMGYVTPLIAALAMSGSSLIVIGNSFRINLKERS